MSRLQNPMRFAAFVEGASHLRDEEILKFESFKYNGDEDEDQEIDSDISINDGESMTKRNSAQSSQCHYNEWRRHQQQQTATSYRQSPSSVTAPPPPQDISEEEADDGEDVAELATSSTFKIQQSPPITLNSSRRIANGVGSNRSYTSPVLASQRTNATQRTLSRSAKMVNSVQRNNNGARRAFQSGDISGDSDGYSD